MERRRKLSLTAITLLLFCLMRVVRPSDTGANPPDEESKAANSTERERRQIYHFPTNRHSGHGTIIRNYRPFEVSSPFAPSAYFAPPISVYATRPVHHIAGGIHHKQTPTSYIKPASIQHNKAHGQKVTPKPTLSKVTTGPKITLQATYGAPPPTTPLNKCPGDQGCQPLVTCAPCYDQVKDRSEFACDLYDGGPGICCPDQVSAENVRQVFVEPTIRVPSLGFTNDIIDEAARAGLWEVQERQELERTLRERNIELTDTRQPEYAHLQFFKTSSLAMYLARDALVNAEASDHLMNRFRLSPLQASYGLQEFSVLGTPIETTCPVPPPCGPKEQFYRTIDGSCNNLQNPGWGQARTPFQRVSQPRYSDGVMRPRMSSGGGSLPSARLVSTSAVSDVDKPSHDLTLSVMQWGQFIDHDLAHTPIFRLANDSGIECCSEDRGSFLSKPETHPGCFPIEIPADDKFYGQFGRRCMNFVRSMIAPRTACNLGYAEQMNQITHYLDGSNIYGSSRAEEQLLRLFRGGLLRVQEHHLLPQDFEAVECESMRDGFPCFRAGDNRVNEQVDLAVIHTVWVRMHNSIASTLQALNPHWSDETVFQETRRIVVAIYQHIVYNEWLPLILGKDYMSHSGILPRQIGYSRDYDSGLNVAIFNEFATAAFRFGHTLVQGMIHLMGKKGRHTETVELHHHFNNPKIVYTPGKLDEFLRGLATQPSQMVDNFVSTSLTNRLFETEAMPFGMDLVALNIQRGRDHAIAPYNALREACGLPRAKDFEDLLDYLPEEVVTVFKQLYETVDDIDAFIAGISEKQAKGSILGPTFRCIVGDQFTRLKRADRFFYDLADMPASFSEAQLDEIRKVSWARILCETSHIGYVQPLAFRQPQGQNERVRCDSQAIPEFDLSLWKSNSK